MPQLTYDEIDQLAQAAYIAHYACGPTDDALDEPNMGRGGYKTEVTVWRAVAAAVMREADKLRKATYDEMLALIDAYKERTGLSDAAVSKAIGKQSTFVFYLRRGRGKSIMADIDDVRRVCGGEVN